MKSLKLKSVVCLAAILTMGTVWAHSSSTNLNQDMQAPAGSPVAYVYVSNTPPNSNTNQIVAYTAAANGSLTQMPGSPFPENVFGMAVNGKYLMASSRAKADINAYRIAADGSLSFAAATDYAHFNNPNGGGCGGAGEIFFDHTGSTLYVQEFNGSDACSNTVVASFNVVKATGALTYLGTAVTGVFPGLNAAAYFTGNNVYAYQAVDSGCMYWAFYGFQRSPDGMLNQIDPSANLPTPLAGFNTYLPALAAADPANHVAFTMQPASPPGCAPGPLQLASYAVDANGNLNTTNTGANMPVTKVGHPYDMKMSPSGKLLAVAGQEGLQVFHFNGAAPITHYTGLLTKDPTNQMYWDNNNHLYAISRTAGKLYVFKITPTGHRMAPGSPYTINTPDNVIVQPLPLFGQ